MRETRAEPCLHRCHPWACPEDPASRKRRSWLMAGWSGQARPRQPWRVVRSSHDPALADDAQAECLEAHVARGRCVGEQHHVADAQVAQDLRADADLDQAALGLGLLGALAALCLARSRPTPTSAADRGSARSRRGPPRRSCASTSRSASPRRPRRRCRAGRPAR